MFNQKLDLLYAKIFEKVKEYGQFDYNMEQVCSKILFLGVNLYPNGTPFFINWDIIYIGKALEKRGIEVRYHDPHIQHTTGLAQGIFLGRHSNTDNWSHSYDTLILSCPHMYYIRNLPTLGKLYHGHKQGLFIDLYGPLMNLTGLGDHIKIESFGEVAKKVELLGGLFPMQGPPRMLDFDIE